MQYETLYVNDNNTAKVRMTIEDHVLEQDFTMDNLDENVKQGMAVFKTEIDRNTVDLPMAINTTPVVVTELPEIPAEYFLQEQPMEQPTEPSGV